MKKTFIAALAICAVTGVSLADIHETQVFAGPYQSFGNAAGDDTNPANSEITVTFTGTGYTPNGIYLQVDLAALAPNTYASEVVFTVTPPAGPVFFLTPAFDTDAYATLTDVTLDIPLPPGVTAVGNWTIRIWDSFPDGGEAVAQSEVTNLRISLQDLVIATPESTDLGTLGSDDKVATDAAFNGVDVKWFKVTLPADANAASGYYVDITTDGTSITAGASATANDTEVGVYDAVGFLVNNADDFDYPTDPWTSLSFGAGEEVARTHSGYTDGFDGDLTAGVYYIAAGAFNITFGGTDFGAVSTSTSTGGTLVLNVFSNFPGGPTACSAADVGVAGGEPGQDNLLDNNDFIAFINFFFAQDPIADQGQAGGEYGSDSLWDNNDFIAFINHFFEDAAACNG